MPAASAVAEVVGSVCTCVNSLHVLVKLVPEGTFPLVTHGICSGSKAQPRKPPAAILRPSSLPSTMRSYEG